jgi:hypothetical protein
MRKVCTREDSRRTCKGSESSGGKELRLRQYPSRECGDGRRQPFLGSPHRPEPAYHFSIDDVFECLIDATENHSSLFEQPLFNFLSRMHKMYGVHTDLYLFNRATFGGRIRTLRDVAERFRSQFQEATWLRLGPHALDYDVPPHKQTPVEQIETFEETYREIERFAGPGKTTGFLRLHFFSETFEVAPYLLNMGIHTLMLTDKPAVAYRLDESRRGQLRRDGWLKHEGLYLLQSHFRMENFVSQQIDEGSVRRSIADTVARRGYVSLFTHEVDLKREEVLAKTEESICWASEIARPAGAVTTMSLRAASARRVQESMPLAMLAAKGGAPRSRES